MTIKLRKAEKKNTKSKSGISGPSGSGKTIGSLRLACGLARGDWSKIAVIDTESSADKYSNHPLLGPYQVIDLNENATDVNRFSPLRYIEAINACEKAGIEVIIIDSATHEWQWCLDYQAKLGGRFADWAKITPLHNRFVSAILNVPAHVIVCTRRKTDYGISNERGKTIVTKVGLKSEDGSGH